MWINIGKPNVYWISNKRTEGDEWVAYSKKIVTDKPVKSAVIRFETDSTCGVFINGNFITGGTGRLPERVNCHEVTSKFNIGENDIRIVLGTAYFQKIGYDIKNQRGYWLSSVAFELSIEFADGAKLVVPTDSSWQADIDGTFVPAMETMAVTQAEYDVMWKCAAPWVEENSHRKHIPDEVIRVAGHEYADYAGQNVPEYFYPEAVVKTNMISDGDFYVSDSKCDEAPYIIYDFGRLVVGYTDIEYSADRDTGAMMHFDFSERISDFDFDPDWEWTPVVKRLSIRQELGKDADSAFNLRRRAFRFLKLEPDKGAVVRIRNVRVKPCMFPAPEHGWFRCSDEMLTKAWEVGKYTLHVNKHQEYESCPRNEMAFFSGDGYIDALVDLYAFGNDDLMNASLSLKHTEACGGIAFTTKFKKSMHQWDYFAWRIICVYLHYKLTGDKEFLQMYFEEAEMSLLRQIERMGKNNLIFQPPCFYATYTFTLGQVDWACSPARLGEKPYLNALLYKSLISMSEMALVMGEDEKSKKWSAMANDVKDAINDNLWSEEKQSYMDSMDDYVSQDGNIIPILFGVTDEKRTKAALNTVKDRLWSPYGATILDAPVAHTRGGNTTVSPLMCAYEAEARFLHGSPDEALELIRRCWGSMLNKGAETFWEFSPNNDYERWDAVAHAWSSGCTYLLSAYVLGVRMTQPGYKAIIFEPNICDLTSMSGVVPTVRGFIAASYKKLEAEGKTVNKFELAVPEGIDVEYKLPENSIIDIIRY
ncbi:MAG: alpha-L-rhamnosidase N-terminal domain-containing protein [Clostridia bacterium]|nr:alpha-L-rhamnosidase N-terminal domain-containing protein [Clostridia bacterium]